MSAEEDEVEVAELLVAWPCSKNDQTAILTAIPPQAWQLALGCYCAVPAIWQAALQRVEAAKAEDRVIVVKRANPGVLAVTCDLRPVGDKLEASFCLLSGRVFAKHLFEIGPEDQAFYFYQLRYCIQL